jgi:GNAT superfamily N-acetyltransferase
VFAVHDDRLHWIAVVHVALAGATAELGLSVLPGFRGHGNGDALLRRAVIWLRNRGTLSVYVHCLAENAAMMHLARKQEMEIVVEYGEADAWLKLSPADASSHFGELFAQRVALFDYALKQGRAWLGPGR